MPPAAIVSAYWGRHEGLLLYVVVSPVLVMCRSVQKCIFILGFASCVVRDGLVLKQFGYYRKHFNSMEWNFDKHAYICVQIFWIMWWHSMILFNNLSICMNVLESMIYFSDFWFDLKIIFLFLLSFLCSRIRFGTAPSPVQTTRGSSCQAPRCCFRVTAAAATETATVSSPPCLQWLLWACRGHRVMAMSG